MDRAIKAISLLLNSRPQSPATDPKALLMAFQVAIKGIDEQAIVTTATRYIRGEVEGDTLRFSPSTAEFAKEARRQQWQDEYDRRPKIEDKSEAETTTPITEEEMARRRAQVRELLGPFAVQGNGA